MHTSVAPAERPSRAEFWRVIAGLVIFSAAFGYVEAAVVAYLRSIYTPLRMHFYPGSADDLFPLLSLEQLRMAGHEHIVRLKTELGRELATMLMLGGAALVLARNVRQWVAAFLICFGVWDTAFYLFLKLLLHWPASLLTWDILFLIPVPWTGPGGQVSGRVEAGDHGCTSSGRAGVVHGSGGQGWGRAQSWW